MLNILILMLIKFILLENIKIPFETYYHTKNKLNYMKSLYLSNIYTSIKLGTPYQIFNSSIKLDIIDSYVLTKKSELEIFPFFNENLSSSYKQLEIKNYYGSEIETGFLSNDKFYLSLVNNKFIEINDFKFATSEKIYVKKKEEIIISSCLGFELSSYNNIIMQLKNNSIVENPTFTFEYNEKNKDKGELILGNKNMGEKGFLITQTSKIENVLSWSFQFDSILFGEKKLENINNAQIKCEIDLIIAPTDFIRSLWENYFSKKGNCKKENFILSMVFTYNYYVCDSNVNLDDFSELKFYEKNLNYTFILNKNDLFEINDGKIYFKVIEQHYYTKNWVFGRIFLKKYQLYFDYDRKTIGIYIDKKNQSNLEIYLLFIFLVIIIIILIYLLFKLWKKQRKKRAFELNDEYEYIGKN